MHHAIHRSVDACSGDEAKKKMLSTILVVGGGFRWPTRLSSTSHHRQVFSCNDLLRFPGAASHLHSRLASLLGPSLPPCEVDVIIIITEIIILIILIIFIFLIIISSPCKVVIDPKEGESDSTCWRGAGVLAGLESARELWIRPKEWARLGQKLLRERASFPWA